MKRFEILFFFSSITNLGNVMPTREVLNFLQKKHAALLSAFYYSGYMITNKTNAH